MRPDDVEGDDEELARFQAAFLDLLAEDLTAEQVLDRLRRDEVFAPYRPWLERFEVRSIDVAMELVRKWGRRAT